MTMEAGLIQLGAMGIVLGWLMYRVESRLDRGERAMDRLSRALLLDLVSRSDTTEALKAQARVVLGEIPAKTTAEQDLMGARR